jgi:hypothetical protein
MKVTAMAMVAWAFDLEGDSRLWREKIAIQYDNLIGQLCTENALKRDY